MATTAGDIIKRALRLCRVVDAYTAVDPNDAADALQTLNAMLAEWHEADIGLPDYSLASLTDELASDAADREAIAYQLAARLAPEYGVSLPVEVAGVAQGTMDRLRLRYFQPGCVSFDQLPSKRYGFDIEVG
ncbi:packaged DNA stabilization gp4 family protein [Frateuria sp. GZRR33]|uniref:packaged DNA stabilization gp4 family protein n=1 Tax=Frateuria sp. GZRR33 TaxID=3351535 RepID=UPI003EDC4913